MNWVFLGGLFMFLGVAFGAFGAHALKESISLEAKQIYQTAVFYHLIHGFGLFVVAWLSTVKADSPYIKLAGIAFICGIVLFSGSLYLLAMTGVKKLGVITPFGGLAFLLGWLLLALSVR